MIMTNNSEQTKETGKSPPARTDTVTLNLEEWAEWRKAAGLHIDPETAEVLWAYRQVVDPYGVWPEIPEECDCVGRAYFARSPGMGVWIEFGDLPDATRDTLWEKHKSELAFPAGLDFVPFVHDFLRRNFGSMDASSDDEFDRAMRSAYDASWAELNAGVRL
jgi:hypothetical protein